MPTNHTPNYSLSQWERADKVRMEDFNEDNAKIDAALRAGADARAALQRSVTALSAKTESELIINHTFTQAGNTLEVDLSGVDWSKYSVLLSYVAPANGLRYYPPFGGTMTSSTTVEVLFPLRSADTYLIGFVVLDSTAFHKIMKGTTFREFTTYSLRAPYDDFAPGTVARLIGLR